MLFHFPHLFRMLLHQLHRQHQQHTRVLQQTRCSLGWDLSEEYYLVHQYHRQDLIRRRHQNHH